MLSSITIECHGISCGDGEQITYCVHVTKNCNEENERLARLRGRMTPLAL